MSEIGTIIVEIFLFGISIILLSNPLHNFALALTSAGSVLLTGRQFEIASQSTPLLYCLVDGLEAGILDPPAPPFPPIIELFIPLAVPGLYFLPVE